MDGTTDIAEQGQLLCHVRFVNDQGTEENVPFCQPLQTHTTGESIVMLLESKIKVVLGKVCRHLY